MSYLLASDAKVTTCYFWIKPDFLLKFLQNSNFSPCVTCFNACEENLNSECKNFEFY